MLSEEIWLIHIIKIPVLLLLHPREKHLSLNNFSITSVLILNILFVSPLLTVDLQEPIKDIHLIFYYSPKVHDNLTILQVNGFCVLGIPWTPL